MAQQLIGTIFDRVAVSALPILQSVQQLSKWTADLPLPS
jgi:hypothetical protein